MPITAEGWQRVKSIFQAAVDLDPVSRAAFLDEACAGDVNLRMEVESLIASHESAGSFIELPAFQAAADLMVSGRAESTVSPLRRRLGVEPVVGWLVCVNGPDRGRDYRIRSARNSVGRSPDMDVCISGDMGVSRNRHAVITYSPRKNAFKLSPGDSTGLTYLNHEELEVPSKIQPYDRIQIGETELVFLPLCSERFQW